jgi:MYXO-CTERM domain-containing protein
VPNGGECEVSSQCASLVCEDGVCTAAPAPALSPNALAVALAFLLGLGGLGVWRTRRLR